MPPRSTLCLALLTRRAHLSRTYFSMSRKSGKRGSLSSVSMADGEDDGAETAFFRAPYKWFLQDNRKVRVVVVM